MKVTDFIVDNLPNKNFCPIKRAVTRSFDKLVCILSADKSFCLRSEEKICLFAVAKIGLSAIMVETERSGKFG